jgi:hypothetical protein
LSDIFLKEQTILSRTGHAVLRTALYMPGLVTLRYNEPIKALGQRLRKKGIAPKAVVEAAMRKLTHMI